MLRRMTISLVAACGLMAAVGAHAQTAFETDVGTAIDRGLAWFDAAGAYNNPSSVGPDVVGLVLLALEEKRQNNDPNLPPQGYANANAADQARMRRTVRYIVDQINVQGTSFYSYRDGGYLMALSVYMRSGGPDQDDGPTTELDGMPLTLKQAYDRVFDRTIASQMTGNADSADAWPDNNGYWCYNESPCRDSSTTQLIMAGMAAARGVYSDPAAALNDPARLAALNTAAAAARNAYRRNGTLGSAQAALGTYYTGACGDVEASERGHGYNAGAYNPNSIQQTAAGTWIQLAGGADLNDPGVQAYLRWLRNRYRHTDSAVADGAGRAVDAGWYASHWYYLWSASKAFTFIQDSGVSPSAGNLGLSDIGALDPAAAPACEVRQLRRSPAADSRVAVFGAGGPGYYGAETPRIYYDFAYEVLSHQCAAGNFACPTPNTYAWDTNADQAYGILVLLRSVGGGCIDGDDDGVCDSEDNCPAIVNPNQEDGDGDGVGNVCDNCPAVANPGQEDDDGDGIGNACEVVEAVRCDIDGDRDVDRNDIGMITAARNTPAAPGDPRDNDGNGVINVNDARQCTLLCTLPRCAIP